MDSNTFKLFLIIALSLFLGHHITLMVSNPADVYWAHWALLVGIIPTVTTETMQLLKKLNR